MPQIPLAYLWLYLKIKQHSSDDEIQTALLMETIGRTFHFFPKPLRHQAIRELTQMGLIKKLNKMKFKLIGNGREKALEKFIPTLWEGC